MTADTHGHAHDAGRHPSPASRFFSFLRPERREIGGIILFSVIAGLLYLATPLAVDAVVNNVAFGGEQQVYVQALVVLSVALLALLALLAVIRATQDYVMELVQRRIFVRMAADLAFRLPRVRMDALDSRQGPELVNRFFDVVTLQKSASGLLLDGINVVFSTLIGLAVLAVYHPLLLSFALGLLALIALVVLAPARRGVQLSVRKSYAKHAVVGWLEQIVMFPLLFRTRGGAELACQRADALLLEYLAARRAYFRVLMTQVIGLLAIQAVASAALLTLGGWLVLRGQLTLGQLVASELILAAIVAALGKLGKHLENWYEALAAVDKLGYLVDLPVERESGEAPAPAPGRGLAVELRGVTFGYHPAHPLLDRLTHSLPAGARVGLVGAAGHGASTLLDILAGLRMPSGGTILLDGLDLRQWRLDAVRQEVALVRGHELVGGTVVENVRLGRADVGLQNVQAALQKVGLLDALLRLPDGLETRLKPGGAPLSSAQRSLLMLARALVGRPRLLLVDETLEGMDSEFLPGLEALLFDPARPWTLILVTRDPDLLARCDTVIHLGECHLSQPGHGPSQPSPA
jgi:putative ABC transport system ATP-binding protein